MRAFRYVIEWGQAAALVRSAWAFAKVFLIVSLAAVSMSSCVAMFVGAVA